LLGLTPRFITAELTMADVTPEMAGFEPLAAESLTPQRPRSTPSGKPTP
jgi:FMN-dependent NADH-azoreductase